MLLDATLDLVTGSRCVACDRPGRLLCPRCAAALPDRGVAARPDPCPERLAPAAAAGPYDGALRALVLAHKEHRGFALAGPLGVALAAAVVALGQADALDPVSPVLVLVPVPSRAGVVRARGHDPMLRTTRRAAARLRAHGIDARVVRLLRQRERPEDQAGLSTVRRQQNLAFTMAARPAAVRALARRRGAVRVVVCDDVLTTGATAREAQRALETVGIGVAGIACVAATQRRRSPVAGPGHRSLAPQGRTN